MINALTDFHFHINLFIFLGRNMVPIEQIFPYCRFRVFIQGFRGEVGGVKTAFDITNISFYPELTLIYWRSTLLNSPSEVNHTVNCRLADPYSSRIFSIV